ncbi:MAG: Ig-like domain-containing protein, partial [Lachnospiraceae bacterium]|nr:Ig-like domain-containing protein [Lachnospiraceae bacterium]
MLSLFLVLAVFVTTAAPAPEVSAASAKSKKVVISASKLTLTVGQSKTLKVTKGTKKVTGVKWSSTKKKVATVTKKGKVKAVKAGTATIKAKVGKKTYKCKVTVKKKETKMDTKKDTKKDTGSQSETATGGGTSGGSTSGSSSSGAASTGGTSTGGNTGSGQTPAPAPEPEMTDAQIKELFTPTVETAYVTRQAQDPNDKTKVVNQDVLQAYITWEQTDENGAYYLPATERQMKLITRTNGEANADDDDGRFLVAALYFCALKAWTPDTRTEFDKMMHVLCDSPTYQAYSNASSNLIKDNLTKTVMHPRKKYTYMGNAYFEGATPDNQYTPNDPPTVVVEDFVYAPAKSALLNGNEVYQVVCRFAGADSERKIAVYKDKTDGNWYIFDQYVGFTTDIKPPVLTREDVAPYLSDITYETQNQPQIKTGFVNREYSQEDPVTHKVENIPIKITQATVTFQNTDGESVLPTTAGQLAKIDRGGNIEAAADGTIKDDQSEDLGRFVTMAAYFAALKAWTPESADEVDQMMELLCESPTTQAMTENVYNPNRKFFKNNLTKTVMDGIQKYTFQGNAYFDGATPSNGYQPKEPLSVTLEDYVYDAIWSDDYQTWIYGVVTRFDGADSERILRMYQDRFDGQWYIFSDSFEGFCADIRNPQPSLEYYQQFITVDETTLKAEDQPVVTVSPVKRQYAEKQEDGTVAVIDMDVTQAKITFNNNGKSVLPSDQTGLAKISRGGAAYNTYAKTGNIKQDVSGEDYGRFVTAAAYFAALCRYDKYNYQDTFNMMELLCESPTTKAYGEDVFNSYSQTAMRDNLDKKTGSKYKYEYMGNAYFDGANRFNDYTPSLPLTVTVEDYVYDGIWSDVYNTYIYTVVVRIPGADNARLLRLYKDKYDGQWYIFSDSWKGFTADIQTPVPLNVVVTPKSYQDTDQPTVDKTEIKGLIPQYNPETEMYENVETPVVQAKVSFDKTMGLPDTAEELGKISRRGNDNMSTDNESGRFTVAAGLFAALKAWTPEHPENCYEMMELLCESPTTQALGEDVFGSYGQTFIKNNLGKDDKYTYLPNAYFDGATPENGYAPETNPYSVTIEDYVYDGVWSSDYNTTIYTIVMRFAGADSERLLKVYQDPYDKE